MIPDSVQAMLLGIPWMEPDWLLQHYGEQFLLLSLIIVFVECGLFFPFLPGDTLLFAVGVFVASDQLDVNLLVALLLFGVAALLGNVTGFEIGRLIGPPLYQRDGRIVQRKYLDQTSAFFDKHGSKALVIGRFVPFVRTYITVVAGVTRMDRHRFVVWSAVGAGLWVLSITLLGYFLGNTVPWLKDNIDYAVIAILAFSVIPIAWEWWRHRRKAPIG